MSPSNPPAPAVVRKATAAPDSAMPVGLMPFVRRGIEALTGGGKRRRGEEEEAKKKASAVASDPIEDADVEDDEDEDDDGSYLTLATIDWARYKPLILTLDEDDRAALEHANSAEGAKAAAAGPVYAARVVAEGGAGGEPLLLRGADRDEPRVVSGVPASLWRGTEDEDDEEDDEDDDKNKRATRGGGSKRAAAAAAAAPPSPSSDDGEESEEERLREEEEQQQESTRAAAAATAKAAAAAAAATAAAMDKKKARREEYEGRSLDGSDEEDTSSDDDLDFRLSTAGWPGASIVGAHKRDGVTAVRVAWDDGETRWVDSNRLHERSHTLVALVQFYESKAKNKG